MMRTVGILFFCGMGVLCLSLRAQSVAESVAVEKSIPQMDLQGCLQRALERNADILKTKEELKRLKGVVVEVRAQALPNVSASATAAVEKQELASSSMPDMNQTYWRSGVQVTQLIFSGGGVSAAMDMARLTEERAFLNLSATIDQIIFDVRKAYYNVLMNRALIEVQEISVRLLQEELENQKKRLATGTVTRFNVLRAEVELSNAKPQLIRARNNYKLALVALAKLMAVDYERFDSQEAPFEIIGKLTYAPVEFSLEEAISTAIDHRPEYKALKKQVEIQQKELTVSRSGYFPKLSLFGGYDVDSDRTDASLEEKNGGWSAGIQGNWDLFDGLLTQGKVDQSQAKLISAQISVEESRRNIEWEVREAFFRWQEARELIASQEKNVEQSQESLRMAKARFDVGAATQLDVLNAQVAQTAARVNELQARYDYHMAVASLERATAAPMKMEGKSASE
ncbi:MAG: TolC family protein [Verrucomicrobiota bacterium]